MKIAFFSDTYPPEINGVATATKTLFDAFKKNGHDVFVVTTNPFSKKVEYKDNVLRIPGITLKWLYSYNMAGFINPKATKIIKKWSLDIIHVQTEAGIGIYGRLLASKLKIPLVYTYHTMYVDYTYYVTKGVLDPAAKGIVKKWTKSVSSSVTEMTTPSLKTKNALREYGVDRYINVIPNGIDLEMFEERNIDKNFIKEFKEKNKIEDKYILLSLGRVAKEKAIDVLLEGYATFLKNSTNDNTVLLIVGDGPDRNRLENLAFELGISKNVIFVGKVPHEQVPYFYFMSNLYISASTSETQGLTFIEAIAAKTLVLCRFDENLEDVIKEGKTGFFFSDNKSFNQKLISILKMNEEEQNRIIQQAYEQNQKYSIDTFYDRMYEVYKRAIRKNW
ncbi:MAG: glycosyltransferase [Bacilli bacterium]|nr:glycosyltransferase [Bacilli bacterium]